MYNGTNSSVASPLLAPLGFKCASSWLFEGITINSSVKEKLYQRLVYRNVYGIVFVAIQMFLGLIGNSVVLLVYSVKYKRSNYRTFVLFLALLDLGSCLLTMPFVIVFLYFPVNFPNDVLCRAGLLVGFTFGVAQSGALVLIAFDRYRKICHPLKKQISPKEAKLFCVVILILALFCTWFTPFLYGTNSIKLGPGNVEMTKCYLAEDPTARLVSKTYYILLMVLFVIVTTLLCILYYFIMKKVRGHSKAFSFKTNISDSVSRNKSVKTKKTTLTFLIITAVYILCTIPHDVLGLIYHLIPDLDCKLGPHGGPAFFLFYWTVFLNNIANPIIYGLSDDRFSNIVKSYVFRKRKCSKTESSSVISAFENPVARSISCQGESGAVSYDLK